MLFSPLHFIMLVQVYGGTRLEALSAKKRMYKILQITFPINVGLWEQHIAVVWAIQYIFDARSLLTSSRILCQIPSFVTKYLQIHDRMDIRIKPLSSTAVPEYFTQGKKKTKTLLCGQNYSRLRISSPGATNNHRWHHLFIQIEKLKQKSQKYAATCATEQRVKQNRENASKACHISGHLSPPGKRCREWTNNTWQMYNSVSVLVITRWLWVTDVMWS